MHTALAYAAFIIGNLATDAASQYAPVDPDSFCYWPTTGTSDNASLIACKCAGNFPPVEANCAVVDCNSGTVRTKLRFPLHRRKTAEK